MFRMKEMVNDRGTARVNPHPAHLVESTDDVLVFVTPSRKFLVEAVDFMEIGGRKDHVASANASERTPSNFRKWIPKSIANIREVLSILDEPSGRKCRRFFRHFFIENDAMALNVYTGSCEAFGVFHIKWRRDAIAIKKSDCYSRCERERLIA